jgi:anti-sigma factor RsiW
MHYGDGTFRAFLDGELETALTRELARHLRSCPDCRRRLDRVGAEGRATGRLLKLISPPRQPYGVIFSAAAVVLAVGLVARSLPATHARIAGAAHVQDVCCFNLDGGNRGDDGLMTISRPGQVVDCVVLYEDQAGTRAFSPRDPVRFISRPAGCDVSGS